MSTNYPLPLAPRDLLILAVLAENPLHGYGIIKAVETRSESGVLLDPANLYRVLRRMNRLRWIREALPEAGKSTSGGRDVGGEVNPSGERPHRGTVGRREGGPRRRTYEITSEGRAVLQAELLRLDRLLRQVRPAMAQGDGG